MLPFARGLKAQSSMSTWPSPMWMQPMIWLFTASGFSALPQSCAAQILWSFTTPVSGSTDSSVTYAPNEYVGDSPAPAPLYAPPSFGDWYQPFPISAPDSASASSSASRYGIDCVASFLFSTTPPRITQSDGSPPAMRQVARRSWSRTCSAALIAALPTMNVMRDE